MSFGGVGEVDVEPEFDVELAEFEHLVGHEPWAALAGGIEEGDEVDFAVFGLEFFHGGGASVESVEDDVEVAAEVSGS